MYGTLLPGFDVPARKLLAERAFLVDAATVPGTLLDLGAYPGLVPPVAPGDRVRGIVYRVPAPATALWGALGAYEGPEFRREPVCALLDAGEEAEAWGYAYAGPAHAGPRIPSGDYRSHAGRG